jgi:hypothetical protein
MAVRPPIERESTGEIRLQTSIPFPDLRVSAERITKEQIAAPPSGVAGQDVHMDIANIWRGFSDQKTTDTVLSFTSVDVTQFKEARYDRIEILGLNDADIDVQDRFGDEVRDRSTSNVLNPIGWYAGSRADQRGRPLKFMRPSGIVLFQPYPVALES